MPASYGLYSVWMSLPHNRYPFSRRNESNGPSASGDYTERLARLPENVPQPQALFGRGVNLPTELTYV